ncbi:MAG: hypothetical protein AABY32_06120, partial [Nanoarchaeota archaeon]
FEIMLVFKLMDTEEPKYLGGGNSIFKSLHEFIMLYWKFILPTTIGCFLISSFLIYESLKIPNGFLEEIYARIGIFFLILPFVIFFVILATIKTEFIKKFAKINNFKYQDKLFDTKNIKADYLKIGENYLNDVVSGIYMNCPFRIYTFVSVIGNGLGNIKTPGKVEFTVCEIKYSTNMINLFLQTKYKNISEKNFIDPTKASVLNNKYPVELEGNFNDFFTLYMPREYEIEALQVFTPDVMELFMDNAKNFSVEFVDNFIFIYSQRVIVKNIELQEIYALARILISKLAPVISLMRFRKW